MLPWDPLWRLRHVGYPVSPRGYRGLPAFASLSMAGSGVFPAPAGMNLTQLDYEQLANRVPRARGDEPMRVAGAYLARIFHKKERQNLFNPL